MTLAPYGEGQPSSFGLLARLACRNEPSMLLQLLCIGASPKCLHHLQRRLAFQFLLLLLLFLLKPVTALPPRHGSASMSAGMTHTGHIGGHSDRGRVVEGVLVSYPDPQIGASLGRANRNILHGPRAQANVVHHGSSRGTRPFSWWPPLFGKSYCYCYCYCYKHLGWRLKTEIVNRCRHVLGVDRSVIQNARRISRPSCLFCGPASFWDV